MIIYSLRSIRCTKGKDVDKDEPCEGGDKGEVKNLQKIFYRVLLYLMILPD